MRRNVGLALAVATLLVSGIALAQAPAAPATAPATATATATATDGASASQYEELIRRGEAAVIGADWNGCVKYFTDAHHLRPSEVTFLAIGRCALERGDYVEALHHLQEGMRYSLTERQRVSAENLKERARVHLGRYRLALHPANATLVLSGQTVTPDAEGYLWLDIGRYPVSVSAPGYETMNGDLLVQAGDDGVISYSLAALEPVAPVVPGRVGSTQPKKKFPIVPVVIAAAGGALIVASVVTGVIALNHKGDLDDMCVLGEAMNQCDPSLSDTRDGAETMAIVTDVLWITGAAAVGAGLLLYVLGSKDEEASVSVGAGPMANGGVVQLAGRF